MLLETSLAPSAFVSSVLPKSRDQIKSSVSLCLNKKGKLGVLNTFDRDDTPSDPLSTTSPGSAGVVSLKLDVCLAGARLHLPVEIAGGRGLS